MRLGRALLALYHARRALRHQRLADAHGARVDALLRRSRRPAERYCHHGNTIKHDPVGLILLASIVGLAICALWLGVTWRAAL